MKENLFTDDDFYAIAKMMDTDNMLAILSEMNNLVKRYGTNDFINPYIHTTFRVKNICEYIEIITSFEKSLQKKYRSKQIFYRGMSNKIWSPIPSVARDRRLEINEADLIHEFKHRCPDEFSGLNTNFELLANMQHYGLPTRLLDFTENPLIALYFACKEMMAKDGRVLCLYDCMSNDANEYAYLLCDIACNTDQGGAIDRYTQKYDLSPFSFIKEIIDPPYVLIKPPYWNERQKRQRSIFLVLSNLLKDCYGQSIYYEYNLVFSMDESIRSSIEKHENLMKIYGESIWEPDDYFKKEYPEKKTLSFVLTKSSWKLLYDCYKHAENGELNKVLEGRFALAPQLERIREDDLGNSSCSIIIPAKSKKRILKELDFIGINESFIYPEKEYIATEIKNKYLYNRN